MELSWLDLSQLTEMQKRKLLSFLDSYLTAGRRKRFEEVLSLRTRHFTVAAEDTYHEHNASALIRTCDCFGIQDMHVIERFHEFRIARGMTKGAEKWVDVHFYEEENNTRACINHLKSDGYRIVATTPHTNSRTLDDFDITQPAAFFFGREKDGLTSDVMEMADEHLKIPMVGFTESFNVSVSAALILHSVTARMRSAKNIPWQLTEKERTEKNIEWCLKTIQNSQQICEDFVDKMF
jgi:tRNA (guanosine-2'-O-)-methyltransferase